MPSPPDCDENPTRPRTGGNGANVAFIATSGFVFTTPMQFGPDHAHAVATGDRDDVVLHVRVLAADFGEPGRDDHEALHAGCAHSPRRPPGPTAAGTATTARSTWSGTSSDRSGRPARRRPTSLSGCTGYTGPVNPAASRLRNTSWPIVARPAARADDGDRAGCEQPAHRAGLGSVLAVVLHRDRLRRRLDRERHLDGARRRTCARPRSPRRRTRRSILWLFGIVQRFEAPDPVRRARPRRGARAGCSRARGRAGRPAR